ncbi:MAG TPA: AAA family ATPase, partial [Chitinolyticbacter sp.]|nr:AAA family ATPase [Chitinolyticbacter sp.]
CVQRRLYVSIATLKRAEGGHSVSLRTASDLARFFGIALPELLGGVAPVAPPPPNWSETRTLPLVRLAQPATTALVAQLAAAGGRPLDESGLHFVFGVDVAGCDSPVHVAHVLLDLQSQHSGLGARLDYGDIVCDGQGFRGARLQHAAVAVAGEIRTSSAVHAVLSDTLLFERCGEDWRVLGCVPSQLPQSPRLVGRALEWQRLSAGIEAGAGGVASLVLLRGGIGVGKSRLAGECALHAQATGYACHVLHAGLTRGGDDTLSQRLVLRLAGAGPNRAIHGWSLEHQALLHSLRGEALSPLMQGMRNAMNPARVQQLLDELLIGLFKQHAAVRPQLLVIEDAHGASEGFWSSLIGALAALAAYPVLVVATLRHGGALAAEVAARAATACVPCLTQDLSPLSTGDARILAAQLGYAEHPHLEQCIARAAGNPLFLACLLPQQPAGEGDLPASLRAAVQAELARLAPTERYALGVMAVAGEGCPADLVQQVGGVATGSWPLLAVRYGEVWRFSSALVREVLYQQMTAATRVALHRRLADWYRERDAVACARHLALGGEPRALDELLAAARIECDTLRDERALGLLDMARALPASARQSSVLHTLLAELQLRRGKPSLAIMHGKLAVEQAAGAPAWQARLIGIEALLQLDRLDEALAALAQMDEELGAAAEPLLRARLHVLRGRAYFPRNRISESAAAQQQALEYARTAGDFALQARARSGLGDAAYAQGDFAGAQAQFQSCLALCGSYGLLPEQAANRAALASVLFYLGEVT